MDKAARTRWLVRGASFAFALILWYFVAWDSTGLTTRDMRVQLQYQDVYEGYSLSSAIQHVDVRVEGSGMELARLDPGEIAATGGISDLKPGKYRLPIQVVTPGRIRLVSYSPNVVEMELYRMIERSLRPTLVPQGVIPENMVMSSADIKPEEVSVHGPEAAVMSLRRAEVRGTVKELTGGERELPVILVGENGDVLDLNAEPPSVMVRARFTATMQEARIPIRAQVNGAPGPGFEVGNVVLSPDIVTLRGTREALLGVTEITINPIDITGHTENMNVDIPLESPSESIAIIGADHVNMRVELRVSVESRTYLSVPVHITGVPDIKAWTISPPAAGVTVEYMAASEAFDPNDPPLELFVDATNVVSSQLTLPILTRNVRSGVSVIRIEPPQATITAAGK